MYSLLIAGLFVTTPWMPVDANSTPLSVEKTSYVQGCPYYHPVYNLSPAEADEVCEEWARENRKTGGGTPSGPGGDLGVDKGHCTATRLCDPEDFEDY